MHDRYGEVAGFFARCLQGRFVPGITGNRLMQALRKA